MQIKTADDTDAMLRDEMRRQGKQAGPIVSEMVRARLGKPEIESFGDLPQDAQRAVIDCISVRSVNRSRMAPEDVAAGHAAFVFAVVMASQGLATGGPWPREAGYALALAARAGGHHDLGDELAARADEDSDPGPNETELQSQSGERR